MSFRELLVIEWSRILMTIVLLYIFVFLNLWQINLCDMFLARNSALCCVRVIGCFRGLPRRSVMRKFHLCPGEHLTTVWSVQSTAQDMLWWITDLTNICAKYRLSEKCVRPSLTEFEKKIVTESEKWAILGIEMSCVILANMTYKVEREKIWASRRIRSQWRTTWKGKSYSSTQRASSKNVTSCFCNHFSIISSRLAFKMYSNYPWIKLVLTVCR